MDLCLHCTYTFLQGRHLRPEALHAGLYAGQRVFNGQLEVIKTFFKPKDTLTVPVVLLRTGVGDRCWAALSVQFSTEPLTLSCRTCLRLLQRGKLSMQLVCGLFVGGELLQRRG